MLLVDNAVDAVVRAMSGGDEPDWWNPYETKEPEAWSPEFWMTRQSRAGLQATIARGAGTDPIAIARGQLGGSYVWAAENPKTGPQDKDWAFDCSGFTKYVLEQAGLRGIPHMASLQQQLFPKVSRDQLQPGDLVFFAMPGSNYKGPNTASHVGLYIGDGKMIDASSSSDAIVEREVMWDYFIGGGSTGLAPDRSRSLRDRFRRSKGGGTVETGPDPNLTPLLMQESGPVDAVWAVYADMRNTVQAPDKTVKQFSGSMGAIKSQLYAGFMDAGRPDLAKMVGTKDFETWIKAESGWRPDVVSQFYSGHGRNAGLFQFALLNRDWVWNDVDKQNWSYAATPYEQARYVVRYFNLTASDIATYADQIRAGTYHGWG